jgi:hypothetical protein
MAAKMVGRSVVSKAGLMVAMTAQNLADKMVVLTAVQMVAS